MCDLNTQDILDDIRDATQHGEQDALFFLLVSTPGGAPNSFHSKVIQPFLKCRGWQKVNYKQTGFRALYFLHVKSNKNADHEKQEEDCIRCNFNVAEHEFSPPKKRQRTPRKRKSTDNEPEKVDPPFHVSCHQCDSDTPTCTAGRDRTQLKETVNRYKVHHSKEFQVHIVLSRPVDYEEDFLEFASQPGAVED